MAASSDSRVRPTRFPTLAKYDVLEEIGHGGMATVYRAHDKRLARDVAIKVIHPHLRDSKEVAHRFFIEAKAVAKLHHANIVEVFDVSAEDEAEQYLVVELLRGSTLRKLLRDNGVMPPEVAAALGIEMLNALAHAHGAGVIHRDVKPENVLIELAKSGERPGERAIVKLTDFGIAKLLDAQGMTSTGQVLGSPAHMAPEQIEGASVDERADIFALGVLLYECMVGHLPFEGQNPAQVLRRVLDGSYPKAERERPRVGARWSKVLDQSLARDREERFANAIEMRDALERELAIYGVAEPRAELEAWLDDPNAYVEAHAKRTIATACALGAQARKRGDVIEAAAHYNHALAHAPDDPELLKIVTTMHRAGERARMTKRLSQLALGIVVMGGAAFGVTRFMLPKVRPEPPSTSATPIVLSSSAGAAISSASIAASASLVDPIPSHTASVAVSAAPSASHAPLHVAHRLITLSSVRPFGVIVAVDNAQPAEARSGEAISINDDKAHDLHFTCVSDLCEPLVRPIPAGDSDTQIDVELKIRDAQIVVDGNPMLHYAITEHPGIAVRAGIPVSVPMHQRNESIHVIERETERTTAAVLTAGKEAHTSFSM
jgi:serine/threonine protein kinase